MKNLLKRTGKTEIAIITGFLIIAIAAAISALAPFPTYTLFPPKKTWEFGPRELAHFIGAIGISISALTIIHHYVKKEPFPTHALSIPAAVIAIAGILSILYPGQTHLTTTIIIFSLSTTAIALIIRKLKPGLRAELIIFSSLVAAFNTYWEAVYQPFIQARNGIPRGEIQYSQILCDLAGVAIGAYLSKKLLNSTKGNKQHTK